MSSASSPRRMQINSSQYEVSQMVAVKITGHKGSRLFDWYNITNTSHMADALTRTGNYLADEISRHPRAHVIS